MIARVWQSVQEYLPLTDVELVLPLRYLLNSWRWARSNPAVPPLLSEVLSPGLGCILANLAVAEVDLKSAEAKYHIVGNALVRLLGTNPAGRLVSDVYRGQIAADVYEAMAKVVLTVEPTFYRREFIVMGHSFGYLRLTFPSAAKNRDTLC